MSLRDHLCSQWRWYRRLCGGIWYRIVPYTERRWGSQRSYWVHGRPRIRCTVLQRESHR